MALITKEDVIPSIIPNTVMQRVLRDGVHQGYYIDPIDGYVLHDKEGDWQDPDTLEEHLSFWLGNVSCRANYDFTPVQVSYIDANGIEVYVTAYGAREFYAVPADVVPADQIFGGVTPDHEIM